MSTIIISCTGPCLAGPCLAGPDGGIEGGWSGRFWFDSPEGEWSDYEYRSLAVSGSVSGSVSEDGSPVWEILLYNRYFSETVPIVEAEADLDGGRYRCLSGYVMSYPLGEWGMGIALGEESPGSLRSTVIIKRPGDYGHVFTAEAADGQEDAPVPVLRLAGKCRDAAGSFDYVIELVPAEQDIGLSSDTEILG